MASKRLNREEFHARIRPLDDAALRKLLWTLYWRGSAPMRERIEALIDPTLAPEPEAPDATDILEEVQEFAELARSGAYLARDRRVSPSERTKWRHRFRQLAKDTRTALTGDNVDAAVQALETLIDLARDAEGVYFFRSEDPVAAAGFVVSDEVAALWETVRREHGLAAFADRVASDILRWESRYGWTRIGEGRVADQERMLTEVAVDLIPTADAWGLVADAYLRARDGTSRPRTPRGVHASPADLAPWHDALCVRLIDGEYEDRIARIQRPSRTGR